MRLDKLGEMFMMSCWKKERLARVEIHLCKSISKTAIFTGGKGYPLKALFLPFFTGEFDQSERNAVFSRFSHLSWLKAFQNTEEPCPNTSF